MLVRVEELLALPVRARTRARVRARVRARARARARVRARDRVGLGLARLPLSVIGASSSANLPAACAAAHFCWDETA